MNVADVIIIGGGIMGTSTAFFLRRRGLSVMLLERGRTGQQASGVNFGNVRRQGRPFHQLPLANRSRAIWGRLDELIGNDCEFATYGHLRVALKSDIADHFAEYAAEARHHDLDLEILSGNALRSRFPFLGHEVIAGSLSAMDGHANPRLAASAIGRAAVRDGAVIGEECEVLAVEKSGEDFLVEVAGRGTCRAPVLVVTAGAWSGWIAAALGETVPLTAKGPQMGVTEPLPYRIAPSIGIAADDKSDSVYLRQVKRGNIVFGGGVLGAASTETNRAQLHPENTLRQITHLTRICPGLAKANIIRTWSGVEGYHPDNQPVLGPSDRVSGLFHAFGFSGSGFQLGPGVGDLLAELIATGHSDTPIEPYSIRRFANGESRGE